MRKSRKSTPAGKIPILDTIPPTAYKEVAMGAEPDGTLITVVVLDGGTDKEALEKEPLTSDDEVLTSMAKVLFTPGVWLREWRR